MRQVQEDSRRVALTCLRTSGSRAPSAEAVEVSGTAHVNVSASLAGTKIHEEVERSWPWLLVSLGLTVVASLVGLVLAGALGLIVGLVHGLLSAFQQGSARRRVSARSSTVAIAESSSGQPAFPKRFPKASIRHSLQATLTEKPAVSSGSLSRDGRIRTAGLLLPKQAR